MLYADSQKRIEHIQEIAEIYEKNSCMETAKEIRKYVSILEGNKIPDDFFKNWFSLFDLLGKEFESSLPVGQAYRKQCFDYVKNTIFKANKQLDADYPTALMTIQPLLEKLNSSNKVTGAIADQLATKSIKDPNILFHLHCYAYLVFVDGVFDELSRILYFFAVVDKNKIPTLNDLEKLDIWGIIKALKVTPVFLKGWDYKNHIRNSIAHARASYDPNNNSVRFRDYNKKDDSTWDSGEMKFADFVEKALEIEDTLRAFYMVFLMFNAHDFILGPDLQ
jgi:hypothetical protein